MDTKYDSRLMHYAYIKIFLSPDESNLAEYIRNIRIVDDVFAAMHEVIPEGTYINHLC